MIRAECYLWKCTTKNDLKTVNRSVCHSIDSESKMEYSGAVAFHMVYSDGEEEG